MEKLKLKKFNEKQLKCKIQKEYFLLIFDISFSKSLT